MNTNLSECTHSGVSYHYYPQEVSSHSGPRPVHTDACNNSNSLIRTGTTQQTDTYFTEENLSENGHSSDEERQQLSNPSSQVCNIKIHHECESGIEKSVPRITDWHHEACRLMTNVDREGWIFLSHPHRNNGFFFLPTTKCLIFILEKHEKVFQKILNMLKCDMEMSF